MRFTVLPILNSSLIHSQRSTLMSRCCSSGPVRCSRSTSVILSRHNRKSFFRRQDERLGSGQWSRATWRLLDQQDRL